MRLPVLILLAQSTVGLGGCATDANGPDEVDESAAPIIGNLAVIVPNSETSGIVQIRTITNGPVCSGNLIDNQWVLTAEHCFPASQSTVNAANYKVIMGSDGGPQQVSLTDFIVKHHSMDAAMIHLKTAFKMPNYNQMLTATDWKMGFYTGDSDDLMQYEPRKNLVGYGYGNSQPAPLPLDFGILRKGTFPIDWQGLDVWHIRWEGNANLMESSGDSGGGQFLEPPSGRVIVSVARATDTIGYMWGVRPEHVRDWALSYVYRRDIELPSEWLVEDAQDFVVGGPGYQRMWHHPLQDDFHNVGTWQDPCDGQGYTYDIGTGLLANDSIEVESLLRTDTYTGNWLTVNMPAQGRLRVKIDTDAAGQSTGVYTMPMRCNDWGNGLPFPNAWSDPLPPLTNETEQWNPCPGGADFDWTAIYDFQAGDTGNVDGTMLAGAGVANGIAHGTIPVSIATAAAGGSHGIQSLWARCQAAVHCHGPACFTSPKYLGAGRQATVTWNPCNNGPFHWYATYEFPFGPSFARLTDGNGVMWTLNGIGASDANATGTMTIRVEDHAGVSANLGLRDLHAVCADW